MTTTKPASRGTLPAELTSFVGRHRELADTRRLLASSRMLTLTGAGGVGKTRLALRVAAEVRRTFPQGVWFVELAFLRDPTLLPHTVANTLELRQVSADPATDLAAYLKDQQLLVVLDNCEHLTDAVAILASKLLASSPGLKILATSRHVLGVEGEQILTVPPLYTPEGEAPARDDTHCDAVRLLLDRASAVAPDFEITGVNRAAVVELCRRLDGIPLAIELATVWLRILTPAQILDRLEDRFRLLSGDRPGLPDRKQALDATVGWSYDLCSPTEQHLWARLSVFAGGFDLEAAEEICSGDEIPPTEVLNLVASLVNKSIIVRHQATEHTTASYEILETVRQYGAARLSDADNRALRIRHRDHYRTLAARYGAEGFGPDQRDWFLRLHREHGNLRIALELCLEDPAEAAAAFDIAAPLWQFWLAGFLQEGYRYLVRALCLAPQPTRARVHALWVASDLALAAGDFERNAGMLAEATELAEVFDDDLVRARVAARRGHALMTRGDLAGGMALLAGARDRFRSLGETFGEFDTLVLLTAAAFFSDDERDEAFAQEALVLAERQGAASCRAYAQWCLGVARWRAGDHRQATRHLRAGVRLFQSVHDLTGIGFAVQALSWCAASASPDERAARMHGASRVVWRTIGAKFGESDTYGRLEEQSMLTVREALGAEQFETSLAAGESCSFDQAIALALGEDDRAEEACERRGPPDRGPAGLTRREAQIAGLLAEGSTNKEIAARLVISQRTVETHVDNILGKLGISSRAQVAGWIAQHRAS